MKKTYTILFILLSSIFIFGSIEYINDNKASQASFQQTYTNTAQEVNTEKTVKLEDTNYSEEHYQYGNDLTSNIKHDLTEMGYPNAKVKLTGQINWIEIYIGEFESTTDADPDLRPQFEYIAREIGSSSYVHESVYDTVCVGWKTSWNLKDGGVYNTPVHGMHSQEVYYHVKEAKISYY